MRYPAKIYANLKITRDDIIKCHVKFLRKGKPWQPDVSLINKDDVLIVVKDYYLREFIYRNFVGLWSVWHESSIYEKLAGLSGIPEFYGKIDRYAFAIEYIDGLTASTYKKGDLPNSFFDDLKKIIDDVHHRNIVLCDMRNNKNVLVLDNKKPVIIDFATSFQRGFRFNILKNFVYDIFIQDDYLGIAKLKKKLAPELMSENEAELLEKGLFLQKEAIFARDTVRSFLKKMVG